MNRIILIGNGFDLAHELKTGYRDFMDSYWKNTLEKMRDEHLFEDEFVKVMIGFHDVIPQLDSYNELKKYAAKYRYNGSTTRGNPLEFKNEFWKQISDKTYLQSWLDIENEYYNLLKSYLKLSDPINRNESVKKLNDEFCQVKNMLEKYLTEVCEQSVECNESISTIINSPFRLDDIALSKTNIFLDCLAKELNMSDGEYEEILRNHPEYGEHNESHRDMVLDNIKRESVKREAPIDLQPDCTMLLNFNYTNTAENLYFQMINRTREIINIHGELNNPANPIIFGYGDELDDDYREIERANDNDFLDNIKSVAYGNQGNYRRLLEFLQLGQYQVFVMGHSCGNSDRTLLNEIFEHPNCISIKTFYHKRDDGSDDFLNVYKNISRNFNNKKALRDIVVNKTFCEPMPQNETAQKQE